MAFLPLFFATPASATDITLEEAQAALVMAQQEVVDATAALEAATELVTTSTVARDSAQIEYTEALAAWTASRVTTPGTTSTASRNVVLNGTFDDASNWTNIGMGSDQTQLNSNIPRVYNGVLTGSYNYDFILQVGNFPSPTRQFTFSYSMSNNNNNYGNRPQADGYRVEFRTYNAAGQRLNYYDTRNQANSFPWTNFTATYNLPDDAVRWDIGFRLIDNGYWNGNFAGSIDNISLVTQVPVTSPETYTYGADETAAKDSTYQTLQSAQASLSSAVTAKASVETRLATAISEVQRLTQLVYDLTPRLDAPSNLTIETTESGVILSWTEPTPNLSGVTPERYGVFWSTTNFTQNGWAIASTTTSITVPFSTLYSTAPQGSTFQFAIRADNDTLRIYSDRSTYSSVVTVAPPQPEPTPTPQPSPQPTPETPVIIVPEPEPTPEETVEPSPEPTIPPTEEPAPAPETTEEPAEEPTENVVDQTPDPEPTETPEPTEPELPVDLETVDPHSLSEEEVEELVVAAEAILATAEQGSPAYEQALEALAFAAVADDPQLPTELAGVPGAEQVLEAFNALGNVGADMAPAVREEAEKIVIASVIAVGAAISAVSTTTTTSTSSASAGASGSSSSTRRGK